MFALVFVLALILASMFGGVMGFFAVIAGVIVLALMGLTTNRMVDEGSNPIGASALSAFLWVGGFIFVMLLAFGGLTF